MRKSAAATLIELLAVIAIVAITAALVFGVLGNAKTQSKHSVSISNLRQLGQAAAMYSETAGVWPTSTQQLVLSGLVPKEICVSPADPTKRGVANTIYHQLWGDSVTGMTDYRLSYVSPLTYNFTSSHLKFVEKSPASGWLVDLCPSTAGVHRDNWLRLDGSYKRLLFDTAVVTRQHSPFVYKGEQTWSFIFTFADFSEADKVSYTGGTWRSGL